MGILFSGYPTTARLKFVLEDDVEEQLAAPNRNGSVDALASASGRVRTSRGHIGIMGAAREAAGPSSGDEGAAVAMQHSAVLDGEWMYNLDALRQEYQSHKKSFKSGHHHEGGQKRTSSA
jgi:hypothetical protein